MDVDLRLSGGFLSTPRRALSSWLSSLGSRRMLPGDNARPRFDELLLATVKLNRFGRHSEEASSNGHGGRRT